jgi:TetR/AcrR family transcriptional regulator, mexJK operon transcriptional repressor
MIKEQETTAPAREAPVREDRKEEQILDASRDLFLELGYADTSMDLVAQRARVSKTTLYTRFPSKEALFAATIKAECQRRMPMDPAELAELPIDEALRRIARRFIDLVSSPAAVRVEQIVTAEAGRFPEAVETFLREGPYRVRGIVTRFFADAVERGVLAVDDPEFAASQFLMSLKGAPHCELVLGLTLDTVPDSETFIEKAVALFLRGARPR